MGLRYRKSVKICKGVRVNFSKSGASLSVGGPGHTVNFSKKGTRVTVGIPGTGLSYSTMVEGTAKSGNSSYANKNAGHYSGTFRLRMNQDGKVTIADEKGREITDPTSLKKIKASQEYKELKERLNKQRLAKIEEQVKNSQEENEKFINIYKLSCKVVSKQIFEGNLSAMQPNTYTELLYDVPMPTEESVRKELEQEAAENVQASLLRVKKMRKQYVEDKLPERLGVVKASWEEDKRRFELEQAEEKAVADKKFAEEFATSKIFLRDLIDGKEYAVCDVFDSWIAACELPVEINIAYEWNEETQIMMLDVDLPEIEDISGTILTTTTAGNLKEKNKTQKEIRGEYATLVFGLAVFISSYTFNVSPAIQNILISGYTQRRDKEGNLNDDYIYSIKFARSMFEGKNVAKVDPAEFCMNTENRCNRTSTSLFKKITPYDKF